MKFNIFKSNLSQIPKIIREQQKINYPKGINIEWSKSDIFFEAIFYLDNTEHIARYSYNGLLIEHKRNLEPDKVPEIIASVCKDYGEIMNAIDINKDGTRIFEIIIREKDYSRYLLLFNDEGILLKKNPINNSIP